MKNAVGINKRELAAAAIGIWISAEANPARAAFGTNCLLRTSPLNQAMGILKRAYPDFIEDANEHVLVWRDRTQLKVQLFAPDRAQSEKIRNPDLAAQALQFYPIGNCEIPTDPDADPGRIRYAPFFAKMYGTDHAAVAANIVRVPWPSIARAPFVQATKINGVAGRLTQVANELAAFPKPFHKYFDNPAGGFNARPIAGTQRPSAHAFGIAVDINTAQSDYWRDELNGAPGEPATWRHKAFPKNRIPFEIVEVFERQGFIWGGKWYHYDTMHFEYRPELLL